MSFDRTTLLKDLVPLSFSFTGYGAENIKNSNKKTLFDEFTLNFNENIVDFGHSKDSIVIRFREKYEHNIFLPPAFYSLAIPIQQLAYDLNKALRKGCASVYFDVFSRLKKEKTLEKFIISFDYLEAKKAFFYYFGLIYSDDRKVSAVSLENQEIPFWLDCIEKDFEFDRYSLLIKLVPTKYSFTGYIAYEFEDYQKIPLFETHKILANSSPIYFFHKHDKDRESVTIHFDENKYPFINFSDLVIERDELIGRINKALSTSSSSIDIAFKVYTKNHTNYSDYDYFVVSFDYSEVKKAFFYYFGLIYIDDNDIVPADRKYIDDKYGISSDTFSQKCENSEIETKEISLLEDVSTDENSKYLSKDKNEDSLDDFSALIPFILAKDGTLKNSLIPLMAIKSHKSEKDIMKMLIFSQMMNEKSNNSSPTCRETFSNSPVATLDISYADGAICNKCNIFYPIDTAFCSKCGSSVVPTTTHFCKKCGKKVTLGDVFCRKCGTYLITEIKNH